MIDARHLRRSPMGKPFKRTVQNILLQLLIVSLTGGLFFLAFAPVFATWIDARRFEADQAYVETLNAALRLTPDELNGLVDLHRIERRLEQGLGQRPDLTPKSINSGFFYDADQDEIVVMRLDDALISPDAPCCDSPAELFGSGRYLLSRVGSPAAEAVAFVYGQTRAGTIQNPEAQLSLSPFTGFVTQTVFGAELSDSVAERIEAMLYYYHADKTLYVCNDYWLTGAQSGQAIQSVVFCPGIHRIPIFLAAQFEPDSIVFEELRLPETVRTIERGAFPEAFAIAHLTMTGTVQPRVEAGSLIGVETVSFETIVFDRDDPSYAITEYFEGRPLVVYDPDSIRTSPALNLAHLKNYLEARGETGTSFMITLNLQNMAATRVYIYTDQGYYGYVVPVPLD